MILIGITTYNRKDILCKMARSLYESNLNIDYKIRIYDDASTEYGLSELQGIFPDADLIHINEINKGADLNTWYMYQDFLETDCDYLLNADADILFSKKWLAEAMRLIQETDGVLSLFNTALHRVNYEKGELLNKSTLGAAGTVFSRLRIEELKKAADVGCFSPQYVDWGFSSFFAEKDIKLFCTKKSYVQHIGVVGFNSGLGNFAYGKYFSVDSLFNGQAINDMIENIVEKTSPVLKKRGYYLFPYGSIGQGSKVVIYGNGVVGSDYLRQLQSNGYCDVVAVIDQNGKGSEVYPPEALKKMVFDYIVIATVKKDYVANIRNNIKSICPDMADERIIVGSGSYVRI